MKTYYGQHIYVDKGLYTHHGIGTGHGLVIHYSGFSEKWEYVGPIEVTTLDEFAGGDMIQVKRYSRRPFSKHQAIQRAQSRLGEDGYTLWGNNCEHFVEWAITGEANSTQVQKVAAILVGVTSCVIGLLGYAVTFYD